MQLGGEVLLRVDTPRLLDPTMTQAVGLVHHCRPTKHHSEEHLYMKISTPPIVSAEAHYAVAVPVQRPLSELFYMKLMTLHTAAEEAPSAAPSLVTPQEDLP